jgi:hypothetical protein
MVQTMPSLPPDAEASFGTLDPTVHRDLIRVRQWTDARDRALVGLLGEEIWRSPLRLELVRSILVEFGYHRHSPVGFYVSQCSPLASSFRTRAEIHLLVEMDLLITRTAKGDKRVSLVIPTNKLVGGISRVAPRLSARLESLFISRADAKE